MKKILLFSTVGVLAIAVFAFSVSAAFAANGKANANANANAKMKANAVVTASATSSATSTVKCAGFVPPGHFIAPGWLKKLLGIAPTLSNCQVLPPGIAKRVNSTSTPPTPPSADVTAPSVPTNLSATATSTSRIDLSWSASTDNVGVVRYQIFRNGVLVATTSATFYSDTGLSASTSYSYGVKALDAAGNASAQSVTVTVVTFAMPAIANINVTTTANTATITWGTNVPTNSQVFYGLTSGYGSATALNGALVTSHTATITGLSTSTTFHYQVKSVDAFGNTATSSDNTFVTFGL